MVKIALARRHNADIMAKGRGFLSDIWVDHSRGIHVHRLEKERTAWMDGWTYPGHSGQALAMSCNENQRFISNSL
jgi:hypothetical protein